MNNYKCIKSIAIDVDGLDEAVVFQKGETYGANHRVKCSDYEVAANSTFSIDLLAIDDYVFDKHFEVLSVCSKCGNDWEEYANNHFENQICRICRHKLRVCDSFDPGSFEEGYFDLGKYENVNTASYEIGQSIAKAEGKI